MSIFGKIVSAIFGTHALAQTPAAASGTPAGSPGAGPSPTAGAAGGTSTVSASKPMTKDEVESIITKAAGTTGHSDYNWKTSIVDLMKLLKLDSSLGARKELATELGYTGALDGSAEMNVWLHKKVMDELMASGGKVPDKLK